MEPEIPPAAPPPNSGPNPAPPPPHEPGPEARPATASAPATPPPVEVRAEPVGPGERGRVVDAPPASNASSSNPSGAGTPPPSAGASASPRVEPAWRKQGWAIACHAVGLIDFGVTAVPGLVASLVVWLIKKDEDAEVDFHGKEAINFQITLMIAWGIAAVLTPCVVGIPLLFLLPLVKIVLMIVAAVKAANGERWRYPWTLRVLS